MRRCGRIQKNPRRSAKRNSTNTRNLGRHARILGGPSCALRRNQVLGDGGLSHVSSESRAPALASRSAAQRSAFLRMQGQARSCFGACRPRKWPVSCAHETRRDHPGYSRAGGGVGVPRTGIRAALGGFLPLLPGRVNSSRLGISSCGRDAARRSWSARRSIANWPMLIFATCAGNRASVRWHSRARRREHPAGRHRQL